MDADSSAGREVQPRPPWWRRPIPLLLSAVLALVGAYLTPGILAFANKIYSVEQAAEQLADPDVVKVLGMKRLVDADGFRLYVVPAGTDPRPLLAAMRWGPHDEQVVDEEFERRWVIENHAVDVHRTSWEITLAGNRSNPVIITNIKPVDVKCDAPLGGGLLDFGGEGEGDKIGLSVDVEHPSPVFSRAESADEPEIADYFSQKTISLEHNEKQVLTLTGGVSTQHCTWRYSLTYMDGSPSGGEQVISAPGGVPFESTVLSEGGEGYSWVVPNVSMLCSASMPLPVVNAERFREYLRGKADCI
jgi:hypothetical protein